MLTPQAANFNFNRQQLALNMNTNKNKETNKFQAEAARLPSPSLSPTPLADTVDLLALSASPNDAAAAYAVAVRPSKSRAGDNGEGKTSNELPLRSFVEVAPAHKLPARLDELFSYDEHAAAVPAPAPAVQVAKPFPLPPANRTPPVEAREGHDRQYLQGKLRYFRKISARPLPRGLSAPFPPAAGSASSPSTDEAESNSPLASKEGHDSHSPASFGSSLSRSPSPPAAQSQSQSPAPLVQTPKSGLTAALLAHKAKLRAQAEEHASSLPAAQAPAQSAGLHRARSMPQSLNRLADNNAPAKGPSSRARVSFAKGDDSDEEAEEDDLADYSFALELPGLRRARPTQPVDIPRARRDRKPRPLPLIVPVKPLALAAKIVVAPALFAELPSEETASQAPAGGSPLLPTPSPSLLASPQVPASETNESDNGSDNGYSYEHSFSLRPEAPLPEPPEAEAEESRGRTGSYAFQPSPSPLHVRSSLFAQPLPSPSPKAQAASSKLAATAKPIAIPPPRPRRRSPLDGDVFGCGRFRFD